MKYLIIFIAILFFVSCEKMPQYSKIISIQTNYCHFLIDQNNNYHSHYDSDGDRHEEYDGSTFKLLFYPETYTINIEGYNDKENKIKEKFDLRSMPSDYKIGLTIHIRETNQQILIEKNIINWYENISITVKEITIDGYFRSDVENQFDRKYRGNWNVLGFELCNGIHKLEEF